MVGIQHELAMFRRPARSFEGGRPRRRFEQDGRQLRRTLENCAAAIGYMNPFAVPSVGDGLPVQFCAV